MDQNEYDMDVADPNFRGKSQPPVVEPEPPLMESPLAVREPQPPPVQPPLPAMEPEPPAAESSPAVRPASCALTPHDGDTTQPDTPGSEETRVDRLMTTSYSEIFPGGSSGRSSVLECATDTLLSPELSPVAPDQQPSLPTQHANETCGSPPRPSAALLDELERDARRLAASADALIESLTGTMYSISSLAVDAMDAYRDGVCKTCDGVDTNIKAMYQVMAKTEELNKSVKQVYPLAGHVREVKRLLDLFEAAVVSGS